MVDNVVVVKKFCCDPCKYYSDYSGNIKQHKKTKKHLDVIQEQEGRTESKTEVVIELKCPKCAKIYKTQSGVWRHSKKCNFTPIVSNTIINVPPFDPTELVNEIKGLKNIITELVLNQQPTAITTINNTCNNNTNNININVFLNETCKNAINLDSFIKNLMYEMADSKLMIGSYVEGTCSILQKNLNGLPLNKRPMHCMEGEDPNQQLMHIRQDDKWNIGTYVNWLEQIYSDDDDDVVNKNPIYYALKMIDDEKLKYLGYNYFQNEEYKIQHSRLHREISRQDLKKIVYDRLLKMITVDPQHIK
jgi:hypothetical protein